jgi:hypothetical protein
VCLRMFWNFISSLTVKRGGSLSFLVGTISNVLVMEIGWTDVGSGGYILVSCAHSNTSLDSCLFSTKSITIHSPENIQKLSKLKSSWWKLMFQWVAGILSFLRHKLSTHHGKLGMNLYNISKTEGCHGRDHTVVGFTTTCTYEMNAYHH